MATVSTVLRTDRINKDGEAPINFFVIKDRKLTKIATGMKINPAFWNAAKSKVKPGANNSTRLNAFLQKKLTDLQDQILEQETSNISQTSRQLKESIFGKKPTDLFAFAEETLNNYKAEGKISTYITNRSILTTLKNYVKSEFLMFQDITPDFLKKYERFLQNDRNLKPNTIHKHMRFLRKLFNDAVREDLIAYSANPFPKYKFKLVKTSRSFLSEQELTAFEMVPTVEGEKMDLHKDMFVFASYVGGLRISDILKLRWQNFDGKHIHIAIHKTKTPLSIKLPHRALEIINKYTRKSSKKSDFIFPMFPNGLDLENPQISYSAISSATAYINKNLKILAEKANIDKPLSFHVSRHSFATRALTKGISIDKVSKLMGHAQLRETQIYAKIVDSELDNAMDKFN